MQSNREEGVVGQPSPLWVQHHCSSSADQLPSPAAPPLPHPKGAAPAASSWSRQPRPMRAQHHSIFRALQLSSTRSRSAWQSNGKGVEVRVDVVRVLVDVEVVRVVVVEHPFNLCLQHQCLFLADHVLIFEDPVEQSYGCEVVDVDVIDVLAEGTPACPGDASLQPRPACSQHHACWWESHHASSSLQLYGAGVVGACGRRRRPPAGAAAEAGRQPTSLARQQYALLLAGHGALGSLRTSSQPSSGHPAAKSGHPRLLTVFKQHHALFPGDHSCRSPA
mmetsp:Transcript_5282/g.14171  ORF Transcript_5282/g.14171 Transcript_5282/m.14171 type:complete len:278 (-) Transcript_5282:354-1187(-)